MKSALCDPWGGAPSPKVRVLLREQSPAGPKGQRLIEQFKPCPAGAPVKSLTGWEMR